VGRRPAWIWPSWAESDPTPLDDLLLARFDRVAAADFAVFLDRERAARDAGYPKLT